MPRLASRDLAFAVMALLRCRARLQNLLDCVPLSRREELTRAIGEVERNEEPFLRQVLAERVRAENAALTEAISLQLGAGGSRAPRIVHRLAADRHWP